MKKTIIFLTLLHCFFVSARGFCGWNIKSALPTPRYDNCSAKLGDAIYIIGGVEYDDDGEEISDVVEKYNPLSNSWDTDIKDLDKERCNATAVAFNGKIYVIGGRDDDGLVDEIEVYEPDSNKWEIASHHLCVKREGASTLTYNEKIFIIGGYGCGGEYLKSIEVFDPGHGKWEVFSQPLNYPRVSLAIVTIGDTIYALGGFYYGPLDIIEGFVPGSGWQTITSMSSPRADFGACALNNRIYIMGGQGKSGVLQSTEAYSPATGKWVYKENLNYPRENFTTQVVDNKIYIFGGRNSSQKFIAAVEEYDPTLSAVTVVEDPTVPSHFKLNQNYPNPFNSSTVFSYQVPQEVHVTIRIYNILGREICTLANKKMKPGSYSVFWDGVDDNGNEAVSGLYFYRLLTNSISVTRKMTVIR